MSYQVVLQRSGRDRETLYWNGSLDETQKLARTIALEWDVDRFFIVEFHCDDAEVCSEQRPFGGATSHPAKRGFTEPNGDAEAFRQGDSHPVRGVSDDRRRMISSLI